MQYDNRKYYVFAFLTFLLPLILLTRGLVFMVLFSTGSRPICYYLAASVPNMKITLLSCTLPPVVLPMALLSVLGLVECSV